MKRVLKEFDVPFSGLTTGKHHFEFEANKRFFEEFAYSEVEDARVSVKLQLNKMSTFLELDFELSGELLLPCDVCTVLFWQPIKGRKTMVVKYGEEYNDDEDELVVIPRSDTSVNVAQMIYEQVVLSTPSKVVHPEGECDEEMIQQLNKYKVSETNKETIDPRWEKLKKLN